MLIKGLKFFVETQRDIHQRATGELEGAGLENIQLRFLYIV